MLAGNGCNILQHFVSGGQDVDTMRLQLEHLPAGPGREAAWGDARSMMRVRWYPTVPVSDGG